jgi:hypothetical protein
MDMKQMSLQRRRVVVLAASLSAMSGVGPLLLRGHRYAEMAWVGFISVLAVLLIVLMMKLRREDGCSMRTGTSTEPK